MKKTLFGILAVILIASLALSCAKPAPAPPTPAPPSPAPPTPGQPADQRAAIIEAAKKEGELVILGSVADFFMERFKGFYAKYPFIQVKGLSLNTAKTIGRVVTEVSAGRVTVDMFATSDDGGYTLEHEGALQKPQVPYPHLKDFPARLQPASGLFVPFVINPRPQGAYNTELIMPEEVPLTWEEMASPRFKGMVMYSASGEEMPGRIAWLWRKDGELDWERSFAFFRKIKAQEPLITKGFRRGAEQIAAGEKAIFWLPASSPPSLKKIEDNAPVGLIAFPTMPTSFRATGIVKGAPHPNAAWLLLDYLTSPEGQFEYTERIMTTLPLHPQAKPGKLAQFIMSQGLVIENTEVGASDFNLEEMAAVIYSPELQKKSEDFFLELMGIR